MKTVIPVGVLFSQTGATSVIEKTQLHATLLAIDFIWILNPTLTFFL